MGGYIYLSAKVDLIRSYLLSFLVLFELIPVYHLIPQGQGVAGLLLSLLLRQLQVHISIREIFISDFKTFVVFVLEDFFEEGRLHALG
jgi:hypothetical protein